MNTDLIWLKSSKKLDLIFRGYFRLNLFLTSDGQVWSFKSISNCLAILTHLTMKIFLCYQNFFLCHLGRPANSFRLMHHFHCRWKNAHTFWIRFVILWLQIVYPLWYCQPPTFHPLPDRGEFINFVLLLDMNYLPKSMQYDICFLDR